MLLAVFVVVLVSPALRGRDSFPLSTYPMYATDRGRTANLATVIGRRGDGSRVRLSLRVVAATDDPLIAQSAVADAIRSGRAAAWCRGSSERVTDREVVRVEVVREGVDVVAMARGRQAFGAIEVAASCGVPARD